MRCIVWTIKDLAEAIKKRQLNEYDVNIIIDGARGNGKSTLAYKLLTRIGNFDAEKDLLFTRDDVMDAIMNRKFSCIDADEMINSAHNRDFFSGDQKSFIKMMNMYRDNYNVLVGSSPYFYDLDTQVRKLIKIRITVIKRGIAIIQMSKSSLYMNDVWETDINKKLEMSWLNKTKRGAFVKPQYHRLTTYVGHLFYTQLSPQQEAIYKRLKQVKRSEIRLEGVEKKKQYWEEASESIEKGFIKSREGLNGYLQGKGIPEGVGRNKIAKYRRENNLKSYPELWIELKEEKKQERNKASIF